MICKQPPHPPPLPPSLPPSLALRTLLADKSPADAPQVLHMQRVVLLLELHHGVHT